MEKLSDSIIVEFDLINYSVEEVPYKLKLWERFTIWLFRLEKPTFSVIVAKVIVNENMIPLDVYRGKSGTDWLLGFYVKDGLVLLSLGDINRSRIHEIVQDLVHPMHFLYRVSLGE